MIETTRDELLYLHERIILQSGGSFGIRDNAGIESALAQPRMTFGGEDLYPNPVEKAAALGYSLIKNHAFVDGNKRIGFMAIAVSLARNGLEVIGTIDEQEATVLSLAAGTISREKFVRWLQDHTIESVL